MSLYDSERRYRRRFWGGVIKLVIYAALLVTTGIVSYQLGIEDLENRVRGYQQEIYELETRQDEFEQENADLRLQAARDKLAIGELERRYAADVPTGERKRLLDQVTERLETGISPDRLAFLIESAQEARKCEEVESKRFLVKTPLSDGRNTVVSFANDAIVVTGTGQESRTADGLPQAWFDPTEPVTIQITRIDGATREVSGKLPLQESVIHGNAEHRFQMRAGATGFIQIAAERCAYP